MPTEPTPQQQPVQGQPAPQQGQQAPQQGQQQAPQQGQPSMEEICEKIKEAIKQGQVALKDVLAMQEVPQEIKNCLQNDQELVGL